MKIIRLICLAFLVVLMSILSGFILSYSAKEISPLPPVITLENFKDFPQSVSSSKALAFADLAWKTFVTLNWPANYDGSPLDRLAIGQAPASPRVWEFYRTPDEVFLPQGENPLLNQANPLARTLSLDLMKGQGTGLQKNHSLEENLQKSRAWIERFTPGTCLDNPTYCEEGKHLFLDQIPVVDRKGNYIIVEIHLNKNEFNQIISKKWYNAQELAKYTENNRFNFSSTDSKIDGDAPLEVKAAWRIFDEKSSPAEKSRYYTTKRILSIPASQYICMKDNCRTSDPVLEEVEVGLVGFHISYKIPQQQNNLPGWIWATFEQVDNLEIQNPPSGVNLKPTLFDPNCQENSNRENCKPNYPYVELPFLWRDRTPHAVTRLPDGKIKEQIPTQVIRLPKKSKLDDPTKKELKQQNQKWQAALQNVTKTRDSVWQYYDLIGTQWLKDPALVTRTPPKSRDELISQIRTSEIMPGPLSNVSMEPYAQLQVNGDSCIACHATAKLPSSNEDSQTIMSDFSFLLERARGSRN